MKTTMTITIEENIKRDFKKLADNMWISMNKLLSLIIKELVEKRKNNFSWIKYDIEFERFSKDNLKDLINDYTIIKNTSKMKKILSNI